MVWHRNSMGMLLQRFFFTLIIFSSILTFMGCVDNEDLQECVEHTCIPLIFVLVIVTLKVSSKFCAIISYLNVLIKFFYVFLVFELKSD